MSVLITGGTGFIGSALCSRLLENKHNITVLTRRPKPLKAPLYGINELEQLANDAAFDVVINLAGEPIADKRWSDKQKQRILSSRLDTTQKLINYFKATKHKPGVFISGSAIGYYGVGETDDAIDESAEGDDSFSSQLCQRWETIALQAQTLGIRTCLLRTGIVLGKGGGALSKMLLPFKLGLGGRMGKGTHWMPWIHLDDLVGIILHCIQHDDVNGPINSTSPSPVTNQTFTKTLGKVLKRPTIFPMPAFVIKLLMGQMGEELLLAGKKILPVKALSLSYQFRYKDLESALLGTI
ncbi:MAG: epimerase [Cycloclasticus sp. symbiont of Poecilosclerida sp. M]|nr:MAG: epimerase [Cycloclasticus sp. symbiont of Poecilosclerida sp. M]